MKVGCDIWYIYIHIKKKEKKGYKCECRIKNKGPSRVKGEAFSKNVLKSINCHLIFF